MSATCDVVLVVYHMLSRHSDLLPELLSAEGPLGMKWAEVFSPHRGNHNRSLTIAHVARRMKDCCQVADHEFPLASVTASAPLKTLYSPHHEHRYLPGKRGTAVEEGVS